MGDPLTSRPQARAIARERDLFEGLEGLPTSGILVIGGYAVSARSIPRYSHDIDLVLERESLEGVRRFLGAQRFKKTRDREGFEQNYGGSWERWQRAAAGATVDLLPASVQDRHFQVPISFARASSGAELLTLRGIEESALRLPVASIEVLIALKLQPLRERDLGDLACLALSGYAPPKLRRLVQPLAAARPDLLRERVAALRARLIQDSAAAQQFLGSRIPGPRAGRERAVAAVGRLVADLEGWSGGL